jgi:ribonuclease-3
MRMANAQRLGEVCQALDYQFRQSDLLVHALTHPSAPGTRTAVPGYERLEFLGDRVLGLVVADMLFQRFPGENEGALARRHAALVRRESVARVALVLGLDKVLLLGKSEDDSGGRANVGTLGDACEAVLGAVFADGGYEPAAAIIRRLWTDLIGETVDPPVDAKTALQEWAQGRGKKLPCYQTTATEGPPHEPTFLVSVTVDGLPPAVGRGSSKRAAEQAAASALLEHVKP